MPKATYFELGIYVSLLGYDYCMQVNKNFGDDGLDLQLCDYEKEWLKNIERNNEMLVISLACW